MSLLSFFCFSTYKCSEKYVFLNHNIFSDIKYNLFITEKLNKKMESTYSAVYVWKIKYFSTCNPGTEVGARIESDLFECANEKSVKFGLGFCPNNKTLGKECTSIYLGIGCDKPIKANISFELLSTNGSSILKKEIDADVPANHGPGWGFDCFALRDYIFDPTNNILGDDDTLTIRCCVEFHIVNEITKMKQNDDDDEKVYNAQRLWKIKNLETQFNPGDHLDSGLFCCEDQPEIKFQIGLCPNGDIPENEGYLSLNLWIGSDRTVNAKIVFEIIKNDNTIYFSKEIQKIISPNETRGSGFPRFHKLEEVLKPENSILKDGCLKICVKIEFNYIANITPPPSLFNLSEAEEEMEAKDALNSVFENQDPENFTEFIWKIEKFSRINADIGNRVESITFPCKEHPDIQFRLGLNPNGSNRSNKGFLSVWLWIGTSVDLYAKMDIELLKNDSESNYIKERIDMIPNNSNDGQGFDQFIQRSVVLDQNNGFIDGDVLTIKCKIFINLCNF